MDPAMVAQVRKFNRTVTQRVGALNDRYLARDRSLGESRLLWEIGAGGAEGRDVRYLRTQLELDSGYVSRLLRSLEAVGLITVRPDESDKRVRIARLTARGVEERAVLDQLSDDLAASILAPLATRQRRRLVAAMAEVERLLAVATVRITPADPADPLAQHCLREYFAELDRRFDSGFDPGLSLPAENADMRLPAGLFLLALRGAEPIGCGALKFDDAEPAYIKRMWIAASARGLGIGRRLLCALEAQAAQRGASAVRLETNRALTEAMTLYRSAGYVEVPAFNQEAYAHHWFVKQLELQSEPPVESVTHAGPVRTGV
jgi:DNA-binding MarR family transcriptional regulator/N-acetylglutamate synthase-like GNAT family acetyltransferase